jgi:tetratricopeptide (TPR) repeat protein
LVTLQPLQDALDTIIRFVPGSADCFFFMAKIKFLQGDFVGAELRLSKCININQSNSEAHILLSEIFIANKNYSKALSALDVALSFDFQIRYKYIN